MNKFESKKGAMFGVSIIVTIFVINVNGYIIISNILLLILMSSIWVFYKYVAKIELNEANNKVEISKLKSENQEIQTELTSLKGIHDSLSTIFFSYHIEKEEIYISKGIEKYSPFTNEEIMENPKLVKQSLILLNDKFEVDLKRLIATGKSGSLRYEIKDQQNNLDWVEIEIKTIVNDLGHTYCVNGMIYNISEEKEFVNKLKQMAYYDELTDLPNRKLIQKHIKKTLARSRRHNHCFAVMFIDLDGFKKINDTLGHEAGDLLLIEVANRLNESVREEDLTGRLGGDEFMIVFEEASEEEVAKIAERILVSIAEPYMIDNNEAKISPSVGISMYPKDGEDIQTLINNADKAMYFAKNNGKNNYQFYEEKLEEASVGKFQMFEKLMNSVTQSDFFQSVKNKF